MRRVAIAAGEPVAIDAVSWADTRFADKRSTLWETRDGTAVSIAGMGPMTGATSRWTSSTRPPTYEVAVTAEVSRAAVAAGARDAVLSADLSSPANNALYQRRGYRTLTDWAAYDCRTPGTLMMFVE
ncbi:GNAT family N-acetyltransferase [Streptomyces sp. NPDC000658]|uniref:GNAT family N-acetyltransferase n=1 Tax=Streptomyces sp. NPDC000658 TaxID=3154266 RepID=UPI00332905FF